MSETHAKQRSDLPYGLGYNFVPVFIKAVQEQQALSTAQQSRPEGLTRRDQRGQKVEGREPSCVLASSDFWIKAARCKPAHPGL